MSYEKLHAGPVRHVLAYLLTLVLALCLLTTALSTVLLRLDHPGSIFTQVTDAALDLQEAHVRETIVSLADTYHFDPAPIVELFPRERLRELNAEAVAWWHQLLETDAALTPPTFVDSAIAELVRGDPAFQEATEPTMRRIIAEDQVAYVICQTVQNAVYPIRTPLIGAALPRITERIDLAGLLPLLRLLLPTILGASVLLILVIWLLMRHCGSWGYIGSGMVCAGFMLISLLFFIDRLDLAGQAGLVSPILAAELAALGSKLALFPHIIFYFLLIPGLSLCYLTYADRANS